MCKPSLDAQLFQLGVRKKKVHTGDIHLSHEDYVIYPFSHNTSSPQQHHLSPLQHPDPERRWRPLVAEDIHFCDVKGTAFTYP
ncbi:pep_M12B_propep domain-containing protein [Caerostris darwini]|uniref:Pep_M12B_propep domain-containing protein n=1 Tax=Caerostris darwini TaxID=1538125 RepID=A0AAV4MF04_9ARAC|nr:pep_M12B_propep domain-containing protein [Caerostris darwini]